MSGLPDGPDALDEVLEGTFNAVGYLAKTADTNIPTLDPIQQIELLHKVREMAKILKGLDLDLVAAIFKGGMYGDHIIDGIGAIKITRSANRTQWDHDDWKSAARHAIFERRGITGDLADTATGEVVDKYGLLEEAMNVSGAAAPKSTVLKELGLSVDEFCRTVKGSPSVQFLSD